MCVAVRPISLLPLLLALPLWLSAGCYGCRQRAPAPAERPAAPAKPDKPAGPPANLVLISVDTLRRDHLRVYGYQRDTAPIVDELARDSVIFDGAIASNTNTAPSHATMFTGLYPTTHGITRNGMRLRREIQTLAAILKQKGYRTAAGISGWSLHRSTGLDRGFELYEDRFAGSRRPGQTTWSRLKGWLQQNAGKRAPFFLFLHLFDPHAPYDPPHELVLPFVPDLTRLVTMSERRGLPGLLKKIQPRLSKREIREYEARYDAEIVYSGLVIRRMFSELRRLKAFDNSLIVFLSDHGETLFERGWVTDHGGRAYDEQIRVPLIIRFPDKRQARRRIAEQVEMVDLLPTVLETLGIAVPAGLAGRSLLPLIEAGDATPSGPPRVAFSSARPEPKRVPEIRGAALIRKGLISTVRVPPFKLIEYPIRGGGWYRQLFNLKSDPLEKHNLAGEQPALAEKLHRQLERWRKQTGGGHRAPPPELSPEVERALRALGYVE